MALITGTPLGTVISPEDLFIEGAPTVYIQDARADPLNNPDSDGFFWGLSGTATYPVYEVGCLTDVSMTEDIELNDIRCDDVGLKATIQQRNSVSMGFTVQSFFPLSTLQFLIKGGGHVTNAGDNSEKFGLGKINNQLFWHVYAPNVYDEATGDILLIHLHRAQFTGAFTINFRFGNSWELTGLNLTSYADTTKPSNALFGTIVRNDASVL